MSGQYLILKNIALTDSVHQFLYESESWDSDISPSFQTIGGIFSSSKYVWYANGPRFEVVELKTGNKIASWIFGSILKDSSAKVACLAEIPCLTKEIPLLVLGLDYTLTGGVICIFDILTSKILRAIQVNDKVSYLHVIDCGNNIFPILGPLKAFDGVVAVGLEGGDVLLIDLCYQCIDEARYVNSVEDIKGEVDPSQIIPLTIDDINSIEDHKQNATQLGNHLSILLNGSKDPHFTLKGPKGDNRIHVNKAEVLVTSLFYSSQLGSLLVGYNFGAWQIWNIINMKLTYTSPVYEENIPVSHFAVQEPADDPRAFCYVWAAYSNTEPNSVGFPIVVLYSLNYDTKDFHEGYGYLYQDLQSCAVRFQTELTAIGESSKSAKSAHCLRLTAVNKGCCSRTSMQESHEDTLTICSIVWNVWHNKGVDTYMGVFDLNQWYKEQMPSSPQSNSYNFFAHICVSDVLHDTGNNSSLLDVLIDETTINQFIGIQKPEEHYYPTALAYEFSACSDKNITVIYNKGQQRALLTYFRSTGPLILLKPKEVFQQAIQLGLTPLFIESVPSDLNLQREFLLNVALEQQMTGFLYNCVSTWCNGSFSSMGCSLEFFLNWCWNRVIVLKANTDNLCETLFDYSGVSLDANNQRILNCCIIQLSNLHQVFEYICKTVEMSALNIDIVEQQKNCLHMIVIYLEVLQWLMNIRLLPEFSENSIRKSYNRMELTSASYPIESLLEYYRERRFILCKTESLLYIDSLLKNEFGEVIQRFWVEDGGNGYYPPPSLQSLLRTYLVEDVDMIHKHCLVVYLFLDLAMALDQSRYTFIVTHLIKFPAVFKISPSITKIIQAFWQLDHGDFGTAMDQILDPLINASDLKLWHHQIIFNALLQQEQYNFALLYFQVRQPPLETTEDILNILSLYVFNHMIDEAVKFYRQHSSQDNDVELMRHIFQQCIKTNQILEFIYFPLKQKEEMILMKYLEEVPYEYTEEFRVSYYLHRSRYMDIVQMKGKDAFQPSGLKGQKEIGFCDSTMRAITSLFPKVTKDIYSVYQRDRNIMRTEVLRPKPMSVFVHNAKEQAKYKSTLIHAGILKTKEIWTHSVLDKSINTDVPFVNTPIISSGTRKRPSIICPKLINSEDSSSPLKKIKLSTSDDINEQSDIHEANVSSILDTTKLLTPIVKRKVQSHTDYNKPESERFNVCTPQSILKVRNLVITESPISVTTDMLNISTKDSPSHLSASGSVLGLIPKRSLSRSVVRFEKVNESLTDSSLDKTTDATNVSNLSRTPEMNKSSSQSVDAFYSPDTSANEEEHLESEKGAVEVEPPNTEEETFRKEADSRKIITLQEKCKSPKGRSSYRGISSSMAEELSVLKNQCEREEGSDSLEHETTPRMITRSLRGKSQEPLPSIKVKSLSRTIRGKSEEPIVLAATETPTSLRRTSLGIKSRRSFSKSVSNSVLQVSEKGEHSHYTHTQSQFINVNSTSSLASEEFDEIAKEQSFDLPNISLSPLQYTASIESSNSNVSIKPEQPASKLNSTTETKEETFKTENKQQRRSSMRLKSRKSLSRMVLERNACSLYTSTPHHSFFDDSNKEAMEQSSKESINVAGVSEMNLSEQQELERMIQNQTFDEVKYSFSMEQSSTSSNITPGEELLEAYDTSVSTNRVEMNKLSNEECEDFTNNHTTECIAIDEEVRDREETNTLSPVARCNSQSVCQSEVHEPISLILDEANEEVKITHDVKEATQIVEPVTTINEEVLPLSEGSNFYAMKTDLSELEEEGNNSHLSKGIESTTEILEGAVSETNIFDRNIDCSDIIEQPANEGTEDYETNADEYVSNELVLESNDLNNALIASADIIEIADSNSSSNESNMESINSNANTTNTSTNDDSVTTIYTDSESDSDILGNFEEIEQNDELVVNDEFEISYAEVILSDQDENVENGEFETNVGADDIKQITGALSENSKSYEQISNANISETIQTNIGDNTRANAEYIVLPQLNTNLLIKPYNISNGTIQSASNTKVDDVFDDDDDKCCASEKVCKQERFLEEWSVDASNFEDVTARDILDGLDMEKSAYDNIPVTDILERSLTGTSDSSTDKKELQNTQLDDTLRAQEINIDKLSAIKTTSAKSDHTETKDESTVIGSDGQFKEDSTETLERPYKMQLRKRRISSTPGGSPYIATSRKRSASMDESSTPLQKVTSPQSVSSFEEHLRKLKLDKNDENSPRSLRNRRAASVSTCVSHEMPKKPHSKKKSGSVVNLPTISEEFAISSKTANIKEHDEDEEQQLTDELDNYSRTRRLTRNQKHILERSKQQSFQTKPELDRTSIAEKSGDSQHLVTPSSTACATATSDRIITRRMSLESVSSIVSTSISDTSSPRKRKAQAQKDQGDSPGSGGLRLRRGRSRSVDEASVSSQISRSTRTTRRSEVSDTDDHSTVSLRRSARQKSKTPDTERVSKHSGLPKKTLGKIPEEGDDENRDVLPVKKGKHKKK